VLQIRDDDGRLIAGEPEAINVEAVFVAGVGWSLTIVVRRQFQMWAEAARGHYEFLSTPELVTVLDAEICTELKV
jgi:hypothetical protein